MNSSAAKIAIKQMLVAGALVVGVIALAVVALSFMIRPGASSSASDRVPNDAVGACQAAIKARLYPASARFGWTDHESRVDGGQYFVWENVTSADAFGSERIIRAMCVFPPGRSIRDPEVILE